MTGPYSTKKGYTFYKKETRLGENVYNEIFILFKKTYKTY